jgi:predicted DNA binding CopG/RHH family protein
VKGKVVGVRLPEEVIERIEERAAVEDLSAGLWIKRAVIELLEQLTARESACST